MAELKPVPSDINLHGKSKVLEVCFGEGQCYDFPCEFLRVHSPSAEVKGHGIGQEVLVSGKKGVNIIGIVPVGQYAIKLTFDDGHDSGLFSWDYFFENGPKIAERWQSYLDKLTEAGESREAPAGGTGVMIHRSDTPSSSGGGGCGSGGCSTKH